MVGGSDDVAHERRDAYAAASAFSTREGQDRKRAREREPILVGGDKDRALCLGEREE